MKRISAILCIASLVLAGCGSQSVLDNKTKQDERFKIIYKQGFNSSDRDYMCIYEDKETGKKYLYLYDSQGAGICQLAE